MKKHPDYNDLARKWPLPIRNGIKFSCSEELVVFTEGKKKITSKMLEQMKKSDLIFESISSFIDIPKFLKDKVDIQDEDVLSSFILTAIKFRYANSHKQSVKKMKPRRTETGLGRQESVRSGHMVDADHNQGDD